MKTLTVLASKGGVGKTTVAANLGGFAADAGLKVLLIDLDGQPTLSSYYPLDSQAEIGVYELLTFNEQRLERFVSKTNIERLDLVYSNDRHGNLNTLLLNAADGRLRLRNLLPALDGHYDLVVIDTMGARSVSLETAVLASDVVLSPTVPEVLAARELLRGTVELIESLASYRRYGIEIPPLKVLVNRVPAVSKNAREIQDALRETPRLKDGFEVLTTTIPAIEVYPRASLEGRPVHRIEHRAPSGRVAPSALETMHALASELLPDWRDRFDALARSLAPRGRPRAPQEA